MTRTTSRGLFGLNIAILALLTIQGWLGDTVSLFATFPSGTVNSIWSGFTQALSAAGSTTVFHAINGAILVALSIATLVLALRSPSNRAARIFAVLGLIFVFSAAYGGISFVLSGFQNNGNSAQMGTSFVIAYASYFLVIYFNKR